MRICEVGSLKMWSWWNWK